jgi:hypothetical protein
MEGGYRCEEPPCQLYTRVYRKVVEQIRDLVDW